MSDPGKELHQIFTEDHREMTRGFRDLLLAVRAGQDQEAIRLANAFDVQAGPHIAFEEGYLYPRVRRQRGKDYADRLYHEHGEMLDSLRTLQALSTDRQAKLSESERKTVAEQLETGLQHAATCGTLLSHLQALPAGEQRELLEACVPVRQHPRRWTQLGPSQRRRGDTADGRIWHSTRNLPCHGDRSGTRKSPRSRRLIARVEHLGRCLRFQRGER